MEKTKNTSSLQDRHLLQAHIHGIFSLSLGKSSLPSEQQHKHSNGANACSISINTHRSQEMNWKEKKLQNEFEPYPSLSQGGKSRGIQLWSIKQRLWHHYKTISPPCKQKKYKKGVKRHIPYSSLAAVTINCTGNYNSQTLTLNSVWTHYYTGRWCPSAQQAVCPLTTERWGNLCAPAGLNTMSLVLIGYFSQRMLFGRAPHWLLLPSHIQVRS